MKIYKDKQKKTTNLIALGYDGDRKMNSLLKNLISKSKSSLYFLLSTTCVFSFLFLLPAAYAVVDESSSPAVSETTAVASYNSVSPQSISTDTPAVSPDPVFPSDPATPSEKTADSAKTNDKSSKAKLAQADKIGGYSALQSSSGEPPPPEGGSPDLSSTNTKFLSPEVGLSNTTGASTISIPIEVPPGRKDVAPKLSLNYNSQKTNGWIGVGWTLDMGAIQRSTKKGVVDYYSEDYVFTLNGSSSELTPRGDWGSNYYGAKIEGEFSKYYFNGITGGWIVTAKNGTKYYFGTTSASRQDDPNNNNRVFKWCLDRVEDTNGNYMTLTYWKDQGEIYLNEILYTGNTAGLNPTNKVVFELESRTDILTNYISNFLIKTDKRLKDIKTYYQNDILVTTYELAYISQGGVPTSLLANVQRFGADGTSFPPMQMEYYEGASSFDSIEAENWHDPVAAWTSNHSLAINSNGVWATLIDMNGDGLLDRVADRDGEGRGGLWVWKNTGTGFESAVAENWSDPMIAWSNGYPIATEGRGVRITLIDMNGDGLPDRVGDYDPIHDRSGLWVWKNTGSGFEATATDWHDPMTARTNNYPIATDPLGTYADLIDMNGDGLPDRVGDYDPVNDRSGLWVWKNTGSGFEATATDWHDPMVGRSNNHPVASNSNGEYAILMDMNGDGLPDRVGDYDPVNDRSGLWVWKNTGSGFEATATDWIDPMKAWSEGYPIRSEGLNKTATLIDMNGDGLPDRVGYQGPTPQNNRLGLWIWKNTGGGFGQAVAENWSDPMFAWTNGYPIVSNIQSFPPEGLFATLIDMNGDRFTDRVGDYDPVHDRYGLWVWKSKSSLPLLKKVTTPIGAETIIEYLPSIEYTNTFLPFAVYTVSSITVDDGTGNISVTTYTYSGGFYDYEDREFRGFEYVKSTAPDGTYTESWVKQDDIFKGLPYEQKTSDASGNIYTRTLNTYESTSPYTGVNFPYLDRKDDYVYDGTPTFKQAATSFIYDSYGNITRKYYYGDVAIAGDERDETTDYNPYDTVNWIVSLPKWTYVKDSNNITKAQTWFTYYPNTVNLWKEERWLEGGVNPIATYEYDSYGNVWKITDPKNNPPTITTYDTTTYTYPTTVQNPLGHTIQKTYDYRFGKVLTEKDPNNNTTTYQYDVFGRLTKVTNPNDTTSTYGTMSYFYLDFGTVGNQRVVAYATEQSGTGNYIWTETYFDGLGRTMNTRSEGPDSKVIAQRTLYNNRGQVSYAFLPYFEGTETPRWTTYEYDPIDRVKKATNPDTTYVTKSYMKGRTTLEDTNRHQKIEEKDVYERLIKVEEYSGVSPSFTLYATTTYQYDVLGNLTKVTDTANNQTTITYDTLSRKTSMTDPDMGYWIYTYDANGNLKTQKDAKNQTIIFTYDVLNRVTKKDYPAGTDVLYYYDETTSTNYKGRLTRVTDASGTEKFYYDKLGRITKTIKTVSGVNRTIETAYDALSRTTSIKYPDNEIVSYSYDTGSNLSQITGYAAYSNYNALGQAGTITSANGVSTIYQYYTSNNRLYSITTNSPSQGLQNLSYTYDNVGNITVITDYLDSTRSHTFVYDDLNRLTQAQSTAYRTLTYFYNPIGNMTYNSQVGNYTYPTNGIRPHAVTKAGTNSYVYDANGNMKSGAGRTIAYNYDNMPSSITKSGTTASFVYDYAGQRVKKTVSSITTVYIGKLYECTSSVCTKYIFGGPQRIANKKQGVVNYYHTDHLGSSSIITNSSGNKEAEIYYYPYGGTRLNQGNVNVKHKFTGQEEDAETGLYYYGARYYDPILGRFISADTIVPEPFNPQSLNRYSYAYNNPIVLRDLNGHIPIYWDTGDWSSYDNGNDNDNWDDNGNYYSINYSGGSISSRTNIGVENTNRYSFSMYGGAQSENGLFQRSVDWVIGKDSGAAWRTAFTEPWIKGKTGGYLPESLANELWRIKIEDIPSTASANGMHAWHAGSNAYLANQLGIVGAPLIFVGGIVHETPLDWGSFRAEQYYQGTVNHFLDSSMDIVANVFGMAVGYGMPGNTGFRLAIQWGNYIPGPGDPDPTFGGGGPYRSKPSNAWGQYP